VILCLPDPYAAIDLLGRYRRAEPTNATFGASVDAIAFVTRPVAIGVHGIIDRHGTTLNTALTGL
jgi:hypothetical protein